MKQLIAIMPRASRALRRHPICHKNGGMPLTVLSICLSIALVTLAADAFGCPNCKDAMVTGDAEASNVARGYFYSILIMLAMPFALVSSFGAYVWREMRLQKRNQTGAANLSDQ